MSELLTLMQIPPSFDVSSTIDSIVKLGFAAAVAWYLLTQTTKALQTLTNELAQLRQELTHTRSEISGKFDEIRRDVREVQEAMSRAPRPESRGR